MAVHQTFAAKVRLARLHRHGDGRLLVVPLDHSVADGPVAAGQSIDPLVGQLARNGVDAVVLHKGRLRSLQPGWFTRTSLIVHLSASTRHAPDPDAKYLVTDVETAIRLGADAVSVHVNLGSLDERSQIADFAAVADTCAQWNMPLLAMIYPRGPQITDPADAELLAHAASLAGDVGADIVKLPRPRTAAETEDLVRSSPVPVITAGGPRGTAEDVLSGVSEVLRAGAAGVAMGRNIFAAPDPGNMARRVSDLVHSPLLRPRGPAGLSGAGAGFRPGDWN
ncbi:2-amino-4,5-dihydroxy-6-one-heptanoic acid-7-phosphate synthase [Streptomonospora alba]|uniref:2-amino-4,5-dihydroxy-6-one-heptanoic acid-7-phosphate synthase n=1 Tax=Streptomonospora alba TaxID=183763 RepID=A0A0C2JQQ8_9ACTN|nr:2-amino-3,7-dideoxy-D-threo-hept-6-ulosonate synthase [Streptomonospora alba]KIH99137.1 2-amino-4,5-dihydroxy-6-one-heptanoic acid-7-phosphate synthase [Streptomonospora alba]